MSKINQAESNNLPAGASGAVGDRGGVWSGGKIIKPYVWTLACGMLLGLTSLVACSENQPRSANSEMRVDQSEAAASGDAGVSPTTPQTASNNAAAEPTGPLSGQGRRYRVVVGTAYFFDAPQQSTPNGKYLRRGDVFYGEGEWNGFVKTGFIGPDGTKNIGWLKVQELSRLAESTAPTKAARTSPPRSPAASSQPNGMPVPTPSTAPVERAGANLSSSQRAVVQVDRAYFYNSPDLATPRKAFCQRGDKVHLGGSRGDAVYVTFTNWEKVTTTGWMRKDDLRFIQ
ncbi:hypothetical protein Q3A66_20545 [Hymenobacter sp. BT770]|uniref:hypothetical protein n=1 Tax=Hymenobacter sp. BT770 TaxID=2886942 RepID=UPI001D11F1BD|nr:hypothetical protein [Hymenobacter sp. BT770]MCC3155457.1 hypothetical protein [Hymenobacter sp. BT770]MDO3417464.1 hypothetical protein [Hymenobacter sp. BT770]